MKNANTYPQLVLRLALGLGFILPVLDRFGVMGTPGTKGVSWGSWTKFIDYTNTLAPFLSRSLADVGGRVVTAAELIFGVCLIIGFKTRYAAFGSAVLTLGFGICMAVFLNPYAPFGYPVFVFTGAGLVLSCVEKFNWSIDGILAAGKN